MEQIAAKTKEVKVPGPDHPISIRQAEGTVAVSVAGTIVAQSSRALRLEENGYSSVFYIPRDDANMSLLERTTHYRNCSYKGDCSYFSIPVGGSKSEFAAWTYEEPYAAMAEIKDHLAFYPTRVDEITFVPNP